MGNVEVIGHPFRSKALHWVPDVPACVLACPVKVLTIGAVDDLENQGSVKEGVGFKARETNPNIRFIPISQGVE